MGLGAGKPLDQQHYNKVQNDKKIISDLIRNCLKNTGTVSEKFKAVRESIKTLKTMQETISEEVHAFKERESLTDGKYREKYGFNISITGNAQALVDIVAFITIKLTELEESKEVLVKKVKKVQRQETQNRRNQRFNTPENSPLKAVATRSKYQEEGKEGRELLGIFGKKPSLDDSASDFGGTSFSGAGFGSESFSAADESFTDDNNDDESKSDNKNTTSSP